MAKTKLKPGQFLQGQVIIDGIQINDDWARKLKARKLPKPGGELEEKETSAEDQFAKNFDGHPNLEHLEAEDRKKWLAAALKACKEALDPEKFEA